MLDRIEGSAVHGHQLPVAELSTSLVLKTPGEDGELGVIYSSFEYNWEKLLRHPRSGDLFSRYLVVGASSYSPTNFVLLGRLAAASAGHFVAGVSHPTDVQQYEAVLGMANVSRLMACDWVDEAVAGQSEPCRDIDILMVANWQRFKRHWLLFQALRRMDPRLRVVLVGHNSGGRVQRDVEQEAAAFGVPQEIEFKTNLSHADVLDLQRRAKCSLVLSQREGACVAIVESLFCGAPVGVMGDAHIGATRYINPETGFVLEPFSMHSTLAKIIAGERPLDPRRSALAMTGAERSSRILNEELRILCDRLGRPWSRDILPMCWRYVPQALHPEHQFLMDSWALELSNSTGVSIKKWRYGH